MRTPAVCATKACRCAEATLFSGGAPFGSVRTLDELCLCLAKKTVSSLSQKRVRLCKQISSLREVGLLDPLLAEMHERKLKGAWQSDRPPLAPTAKECDEGREGQRVDVTCSAKPAYSSGNARHNLHRAPGANEF